MPEGAEEQAALCFAAIASILAEAGMALSDIVWVNAYVTAREHMAGYMRACDRAVAPPPPASTLMIVGGFIHAGEAETSLMMAFRPELVRREAIEDFVPNPVAIAMEFAPLRVTRPIGFGWMAQDVGPKGAMGDAASGTAAKGKAARDGGADAFIALLRDVERFDVARLAKGPPTV